MAGLMDDGGALSVQGTAKTLSPNQESAERVRAETAEEARCLHSQVASIVCKLLQSDAFRC